jgi:hypothetical protein
MTLSVKVLSCFLGVVLFNSSIGAVTSENPYHTILDRNPFGLNPPPPIATNCTVPPPKDIKFNGITYLGGRKRAFFTIPGKEPKDPPQYVTLSENEKSDVLEVTKIFKEEGEVEVINSGIKMILNFKNNGSKGMAAPPMNQAAVAAVPLPVVAGAPVYTPVNNGGSAPLSPVYNSQINHGQSVIAGTSGQSGAVFQGGMVARGGGQSRIGGDPAEGIDPVTQRMNMESRHLAQTAAYERGETLTRFKPQTDPKVFSPGGVVPVQRPAIPPPPLPPSAPGTSPGNR